MPLIIQILGPTASGKSEIALLVAEKFCGEIVSADSVQVYHGFNIGSAKLTAAERKGIPHHLIDIIDDCRQYNAAQFLQKSYQAVQDILSRNKQPVICGGTALYLKTMIHGIFPEKEKKPELRANLLKRIEAEGSVALWKELEKIDPQYASKISPNDRVRITRALEIYYQNNLCPTEIFKLTESPFKNFDFLRIGLSLEREELYRRINQRVDRMIEQGLVQEVEQLLKEKPENCPPFKSIGYKEVLLYLKGQLSYQQTIEEIKKHSRQFAKRQLSWFRQEKDIHWFSSHQPEKIINFIREKWSGL